MKASETKPVELQDGQMTRRAILRKAGWITPLVVATPLLNTAMAVSTTASGNAQSGSNPGASRRHYPDPPKNENAEK